MQVRVLLALLWSLTPGALEVIILVSLTPGALEVTILVNSFSLARRVSSERSGETFISQALR